MNRQRLLRICLLCCLGLCACLLQTGCVTSAVYWSEDGSKGIFVNRGAATLMDAEGQIISQMQSTSGYVFWQGDRAYLAKKNEAAATGQAIRWNGPTNLLGMKWRIQPMGLSPHRGSTEVIRWNGDGSHQSLFSLDYGVLHLCTSPDDTWLAAIAIKPKDETGDSALSLWVYHQPTRLLFLLDEDCGLPICFTAENRLIYLRGTDIRFGEDPRVGELVEIELNTTWESPPLEHLLYVPADTTWMQSIGQDLILTTHQRNLPSVSMTSPRSDIYQLYYFTRAERGLAMIADSVGKWFSISPDNQRILFEQIEPTPDGKVGRRQIAVMQTNGTNRQVLRDLPDDNLPNWHGNDEITYLSDNPTGPAKEPDHSSYDLINYRIDGDQLTPVTNLTHHWENALKPASKPPATQPAGTQDSQTE